MPRQYGKTLESIRSDHVERYEVASDCVTGMVLDAACRCGYGAFLIASFTEKIEHVRALDVSQEAIQYARAHWNHERVKFLNVDLNQIDIMGQFDWLVCFETIEHLEDPKPFLKMAAKYCKKFICSVPNENVIPKKLGKFKYHYRHYTKQDIVALLYECGWSVHDVGYQYNHEANGIRDEEGRTIILVGESYENSLLDKTK